LADSAELVDAVKLPADARKVVASATTARSTLEAVQPEAQESTAPAARELRKRLSLSIRDVADLLGISHQRVQQLARAR
jgi:DNA-binding transcriptional regulator YiaG